MPDDNTPPTFDADTEAELDEASTITPEDIARAQLSWREHAPKKFKELLDSETTDDPGA